MTQEALKLALYYLEQSDNYLGSLDHSKPIAAIKEALAQIEREYERGFIDGMQKQMQSSVDKAVNRMAQIEQDGECKYCTNGCPACDARRQSNVLP